MDAAPLETALRRVAKLTATLGARGVSGDLGGMLGHSADNLELFSIVVIGWMHLKLTNTARGEAPFARGLRQSGRYWFATELPRVEHLATLCASAEPSYLDMQDEWF